MTLPPGISVLATTIYQASFLPLTLGILDHYVLRPYRIHDLPTWVTVVTCLFSPLMAFSIQVLSGDLVVYVKAKRAGAVLPPHDPTWVPGDIYRVLNAPKTQETAYLGNVSADCHSDYSNYLPKVTFLRIGPESLDIPSTSGVCSPIASVFLLPTRAAKDSKRLFHIDFHSGAGAHQSPYTCIAYIASPYLLLTLIPLAHPCNRL